MKAVRWYEANFDAPKLRKLSEGMLRDEYRAASPWGFRMTERRNDRVVGSYYERVPRIEVVTDPFGNVTEYERVEFKTVEFVLRTAFPAIELLNPSRGLGDFFTRIVAYAEYDVAIAPIRVDVGRWVAAIEERTGAEILALDIADIALSAEASGAVRIEGVADVRSTVAKFLGRRSHRVVQATVRWPGTPEAVCDIREFGRAKLKAGRSNDVVDVLRGGLSAAAAI